MSVAFMAMLGSMILLPLYLQNIRGLSALQTGLLVMPGGLAMGLLGPTVGRLFDRFGGRPLVIPGAIGIMLALAGFTQVAMTMPYWQILGLHVAADGGPRRDLHPGLHPRTGRGSPAPLLPRQLDPGHAAAGRRRPSAPRSWSP